MNDELAMQRWPKYTVRGLVVNSDFLFHDEKEV
jgi:hypothetical protein